MVMYRKIYHVHVQKDGRWTTLRSFYITAESAEQTAKRISEEQHTLTKVTMNKRPHKFFLHGKEPTPKEFLSHVWVNIKEGWDEMLDDLRALPIRKENADDGNDH